MVKKTTNFRKLLVLPNTANFLLRLPGVMKQLSMRHSKRLGKNSLSQHIRELLVDSMKKKT